MLHPRSDLALDNTFNPFHPADSFHLRDSFPVCSAHVVLDAPSGRGQTTGTIHIDGFNPNYDLLNLYLHGSTDLLPYLIRQYTGLPFSGATSSCP
jgi:hypothetical protein